MSEICDRLRGRLSDPWIKNLCKDVIRDISAEQGVQFEPRRPRAGGFQKLTDARPISSIHLAVGVKLNNYREIKRDMQPRAFCEAYAFANPTRLRRMELGQHEFTLSELQKIASIIEKPLEELVSPFTRNVYAA